MMGGPQGPMGAPMPAPGGYGMQPPPVSSPKNQRKYTCKIQVGIENDNEFGVSQKVIQQVARKIWKDISQFQEMGGKTRLRGRGSGFLEGPEQKEAREPLQLCISCRDPNHYAKAKDMATFQLEAIHDEYR